MLTTLAPTLALHASPLPSSLQTALDPAYPVPLRSSACYEDALLAEERARNGSTQLRCSAPVEAPPDGVRYEKATFPVFIPKCECERVMREIRAYCKAEEPLGDLNLDKFGCMYDEWCTEVLCAVRKADCCPFRCAPECLPECPDAPPPPPDSSPPPPPSPPSPPPPPAGAGAVWAVWVVGDVVGATTGLGVVATTLTLAVAIDVVVATSSTWTD